MGARGWLSMRNVTRIMAGAALLIGAAGCLRAAEPSPTVPSSEPGIRWVTEEVRGKGVTRHVFVSAAAQAEVSYHLYRPKAYDAEPGRRFPVIYWLHGSGGGLGGIPRLARHFDQAIEAGKLPPCLVVFVNGLEMGMYVDWSDGTRPMETQVVRELVPHVDATWRTVASREGRVIEGFSMGGYGAGRLGFKFPEVFGAVSMLGAGPMQEELRGTPRASSLQARELLERAYGGEQARFREASPRRWVAANAARIARETPVRLVVGEKDSIRDNNAAFSRHLESLGIPHEWRVIPGVAHDPDGVQRGMGEDGWAFYRKAFGRLGNK